MCAIVDVNVANEVFGPTPTPAGEQFLGWVGGGSNRLVAGGQLLDELTKGSPDFRQWTRQAVRTGRMRILDESEVRAKINLIEQRGLHSSNDPHVLAVALLSGARLLYSNDGELQQDFKNKMLIDKPRGTIYSTRKTKNFTSTHKKLLGRKNLCRT